MFKKRTKVPTANLEPSHLYWVEDGKVVDMGSVSLEDLKLLAYVTQEAKIKLATRKNTASTRTLSRALALAQRMYDAGRLTKQ